jgi:histidine ammonia-lyase
MEEDSPETLQDPYSIRCTPQITGVLDDALQWISDRVTTEANSSNDNPIFDFETGRPLMSGNFYGERAHGLRDGCPQGGPGVYRRYVRPPGHAAR